VSAHGTVKASVCDQLQLSLPRGSKAREEEKNLPTDSVGGNGDRKSGSASMTPRGAGGPPQLKGKARRGAQHQVGRFSPARRGPVAAWQAYGEANQRLDAEKRRHLADPPASFGEMGLARPFRNDAGAVTIRPSTSDDQQKGCGAAEVRVAPHLRAARPLAERRPVVEPTYGPRTVVIEYITQDGVIASLDGVLGDEWER
jgi:hypothetical protein